jgi:hypothetical protein
MSQTTTRDERKSALDDFATSARQDTVTLPAVTTHAPPPSLVHGAQALPVARDEAKILQRLRQLAAAAGDDWFYRIPFKDRKSGRTTFVEGPSVKLANDLARIYGNCDVDSWVSGEGGDYWEITARFIDLESGFSMTRPFRQRKSAARIGGGDEARNAEASFNIGVSKAERNVVVNALQTYGDFAFEEARNALVDRVGKDVEGWRAKILERLQGMVDLPRVEAVIGRPAADWLAPDIARVAAMGKAIRDGMATVDETFPPLGTTAKGSDNLKAALQGSLDAFAAGKPDVIKETGGEAPNPPVSSPPSDTAGATLPPSAPADTSVRAEAISRLLKLAADSDIDEDERLARIDHEWPAYKERFADWPHLKELFDMAEKVARGALKADKVEQRLVALP